jgi:hypothetical protein
MAASRSERPTARAWISAGGLLLTGALFLAHWLPPDDPRLVLCFVRRVFHVACPGCGLIRSLAALARGDLTLALAMHPLGPIFVAEATLLWSAWGFSLASRDTSLDAVHRSLNKVLVADATLLVAVWLVRLSTGTLPS